MKRLVVLCMVGVVTGCAAQKWNHPTSSQYDFNRDKAICSMEADRANPSRDVQFDPRMNPMQQAQASAYSAGANFGRAFALKQYFEDCMTAKGYYQVRH